MEAATPDPLAREQDLDKMLAANLNAAAAGRPPRREALLGQHPDLAPELAAFLDHRERFDRQAEPLRKLAADPDFVPGPVHGYDQEAEIARGGGGVWKTRQKGLNRTTALKILRAGALTGPAELRRFCAEAEAIAALDSAGIVHVYEVGEHDGLPFLIMKYLEGGSLADGIDRFDDDPMRAGLPRRAG
jgi:serine/threonine protein kinase